MTAIVKATFVDQAAPQAEWRLAHRVADAAYPAVFRRVLTALTTPEDETRWAPVEERLRAGDANGAVMAVDLDGLAERLMLQVFPRVQEVYGRVADVVTRHTQRGLLSKQKIPASAFRQVNQRALEWAAQRSSVLVTGVTTETRAAIRALVARSIQSGIPPRTLARRLRQVVGLTERQALSVETLREQLAASGLAPSAVDVRIASTTAKALRQRAENIARTELMTSANAGQVGAWQQGRSEGLIDAELVKTFLVTPDDRLCPICEPLEGEQRAVDEAFSFGGLYPPVHSSCRCAVGLALPRRR